MRILGDSISFSNFYPNSEFFYFARKKQSASEICSVCLRCECEMWILKRIHQLASKLHKNIKSEQTYLIPNFKFLYDFTSEKGRIVFSSYICEFKDIFISVDREERRKNDGQKLNLFVSRYIIEKWEQQNAKRNWQCR